MNIKLEYRPSVEAWKGGGDGITSKTAIIFEAEHVSSLLYLILIFYFPSTISCHDKVKPKATDAIFDQQKMGMQPAVSHLKRSLLTNITFENITTNTITAIWKTGSVISKQFFPLILWDFSPTKCFSHVTLHKFGAIMLDIKQLVLEQDALLSADWGFCKENCAAGGTKSLDKSCCFDLLIFRDQILSIQPVQ